VSAQIIAALRKRAQELQDAQEYGALHGDKPEDVKVQIRGTLIQEFRALADEAEQLAPRGGL